METPTRLRYVFQGIDGLGTNVDADSAVTLAALDSVAAYAASTKAAVQARLDAALSDNVPPTPDPAPAPDA